MTQDLKTKIAEAIEASPDGPYAHEWAAQAALQAIHDAGYELTPRTATAIALIERGMDAVDALKAKYVVVPREPTEAMLDVLENFPDLATGKEVYAAMLKASQPETEEG